jgi:parallel beta-helix repeat protein
MSLFQRSLCMCVTLWSLAVIHAFGATSQVGTCTSFTPQFATIQAAVTAASSGQTIYVCPGSYPEQVAISTNLTLEGLQVGHSGLAAVTVPAGGVVVNATSLGGNPVAAQIVVTGGARVTISDLTVDGYGNGIATCATDLVGIYFQNASGTVTESAVLNEVLPAGFTGCQSGEGIYAESGSGGTSTINVNTTTVENYQKNGITGNSAGTTLTATNNTIVGQGSTTGAAENGIQIGFGATGTLTSNTVTDDVWGPDTSSDAGDAAAGILVYASSDVDIESNQVTDTQFGIVTVSDPTLGPADFTTIRSNSVSATHIFDAIDVCSNHNAIESNTINVADEAGIHLDDTCGTTGNNNTATGNTVNASCAGILKGSATTGNTITDIYYNVQNVVLAGDSCTLPASITPGSFLKKTVKVKKTGRPKFMPLRP